jgi:hypothetical protein
MGLARHGIMGNSVVDRHIPLLCSITKTFDNLNSSTTNSTELDQFLEAYQVKSNMNVHDKTEISQAAQKFDAEGVLPCILSSECRILSIAL